MDSGIRQVCLLPDFNKIFILSLNMGPEKYYNLMGGIITLEVEHHKIILSFNYIKYMH